MKSDMTIVVSSCDAYSDCWDPFFKLFQIYWPDCPYPVVLITETKSYNGMVGKVRSFPALTESGKSKLKWGGGLIECLKTLESQTILYLQEDFFLTDRVDQEMIEAFVAFMQQMSWTHETTMHIGLCPRSSHGPFHVTEHPLLWEVGKQARYRFSLQPGLWNRENLLKYIKYSDTAWAFEENSHIRGRRSRSRVLTVNRHIFSLGGRQIYPFDPAGGIVRGKWSRDRVAGLFELHGIKIDFSLRGCLEDIEKLSCDLNKEHFFHRLYRYLHWRLLGVQSRINEIIDWVRY